MSEATKNIVIVGVGGQGTLLASRVIGNAIIKNNYDVKVSEVHGMSQRGGSVITYVSYSRDKVYSPVIFEGCADLVLAFELLEAYRAVSYLNKTGRIIVNTQQIDPMPVITGAAQYPENILEKITALGVRSTAVPAMDIAEKIGNLKVFNMVLIATLAASMNIPKATWLETITELIPSKLLEANLQAFEAGWALVLSQAYDCGVVPFIGCESLVPRSRKSRRYSVAKPIATASLVFL